ncbi:transcriptional regulator [Pelotomaculum thermopropionicum SI]|uniref:Transcriptional regulator n=1 Tax=Pelotomaculum thermopropionicum (strain DSM 13744 / JCM 10971 / SI) TaxID=370438 RepID=A5D1Z5_PELTS|nr:transcriptional regulator [Pelotomaculum thermopropionicum SI]
MEMHQLEYVLAVAKYNSFTRAAEEIKISQSSLSQQISKLENELGVSLFARTTRSVQLTPAGAEFVAYAKRIISEAIEARRCIQEYVAVEKGHLNLGVIPIIGYYNLPNLLANFAKNYPGITISLLEEQCDELLRLLQASKIDAAIVQHVIPEMQLQYYPLLTDQMVVVTYDRHPFSTRKSVDIRELKNERFIVTPPVSGHYHDFINACHLAGFEPKVLVTCSMVRTILGLVREEVGITVLSSCVAALDKTPGLSIIPLTPPVNRKIVLAVSKNNGLSPALKVFVKYIPQWVNAKQTA